MAEFCTTRQSASRSRISASAGQNFLLTNTRAAAIAKQNHQKQPSGAAGAGRVKFRIMYIMFKAD